MRSSNITTMPNSRWAAWRGANCGPGNDSQAIEHKPCSRRLLRKALPSEPRRLLLCVSQGTSSVTKWKLRKARAGLRREKPILPRWSDISPDVIHSMYAHIVGSILVKTLHFRTSTGQTPRTHLNSTNKQPSGRLLVLVLRTCTTYYRTLRCIVYTISWSRTECAGYYLSPFSRAYSSSS